MAKVTPNPDGIMGVCRERAAVAADHPTWSVAYAEDVPKLLARIEQLQAIAHFADQLFRDNGFGTPDPKDELQAQDMHNLWLALEEGREWR